ncbi:hypothetical protein SK128_004748 [Halocaridina rubra]|uniref:Uncharacterized protein n=1 Tax=Halocaridina rubra TaxID=373956 RepID=A0AAN8XLB8_HALRR
MSISYTTDVYLEYICILFEYPMYIGNKDLLLLLLLLFCFQELAAGHHKGGRYYHLPFLFHLQNSCPRLPSCCCSSTHHSIQQTPPPPHCPNQTPAAQSVGVDGGEAAARDETRPQRVTSDLTFSTEVGAPPHDHRRPLRKFLPLRAEPNRLTNGGLHGQTVRRTRFDRLVFEVMFERVKGVFGCRIRSTNVFDNQIPRSHVEHHFKHFLSNCVRRTV